VIGVTLLDYGMGNLHSLAKALAAPGVRVRIETDPAAACDTDRLVLPGVGAFAPAALHLAPHRTTLRRALENGLPCLGICLGMQLLLDSSEEGPGAGLGLVAGTVRRLRAAQRPQIGWNTVETSPDRAFTGTPLPHAYYANSYVAEPTDPGTVVAWSQHESDRFPAAIRAGNTLGVQFHPEKSSFPGLALLQHWIREPMP
jgi:glutamine amidotransferase